MTQVDAPITAYLTRLMEAVAALGPELCFNALDAFDDPNSTGDWNRCVLARAYGPPGKFFDDLAEVRDEYTARRQRIMTVVSSLGGLRLSSVEAEMREINRKEEDIYASRLGITGDDLRMIYRAFDNTKTHDTLFQLMFEEAAKIDSPDYRAIRRLLTEVANGEAGWTESGTVTTPVHGGGAAGEAQGGSAHEVQWADAGGGRVGVAEEPHPLAGV